MHVLSPFLAMKPRKPKSHCIFECANQFRLCHVHNNWSVNFPSTTAEMCFNHHLNLQPVLDITNNRRKKTYDFDHWRPPSHFFILLGYPKNSYKHVGVCIYICVCVMYIWYYKGRQQVCWTLLPGPLTLWGESKQPRLGLCGSWKAKWADVNI